jgi:hypothetical protein
MTSVVQGDSVTLTAQFYEYAGGPATDLSSPVLRVYGPDSALTLTVTPTHVSTGLYSYLWAPGTSGAAGDYQAVWSGLDAQSETVQASEVVTVLAAASGTWASVADVLEITGATVTQPQLVMAQHIIDMVSGRSYEVRQLLVDNNRTRDLRFLKQAVAYQAAWMLEQPDLFSRMNVLMVNQDTSQATFGAYAMLLGPLARMALTRVSWRGTKSMKVQREKTAMLTGMGVQPAGTPVRDYGWEDWRPM